MSRIKKFISTNWQKIAKTSFIILLLSSFTLSGCSLSGCTPGGQKQGPSEKLTIDWWGVGRDEEFFARPIARYEDKYSNIDINYVQKNPETYEEELVDALAANQGPDVAMIHSDWFWKHKAKLSPLSLEDEKINSFKDLYLPVVYNLVLEDNQLYGMPFYINTLGLYINRDHFDQQRLRKPPQTWNDFNYYVKKLTKREGEKIKQAGAAIGTDSNISQANDILLTMMLQNGTEISSSDKNSATFHTAVQGSNNQPVYTGRKALKYYASFSDPRKDIYSWNKNKKQDWVAFADGDVSMIFEYQARAIDIYNRNPELDFEFGLMPQIENAQPEEKRVLGKYWFYAVTNNTDNHQWTWDFLQFLASQKSSSSLSEESQRYKDEIEGEKIFYTQAPMAKTVYKGKYPEEFSQAFSTMIGNVAAGKEDIRTAIDGAAAKITNMYRRSQ